MELSSVDVGWLSILPSIIAIGLALITKEGISSLVLGILSGTLIYTVAMGQNPFVDTFKNTVQLMSDRLDINIIVFLALVGALVVIIIRAGGSKACGELMNRKLKSRGGLLLPRRLSALSSSSTTTPTASPSARLCNL